MYLRTYEYECFVEPLFVLFLMLPLVWRNCNCVDCAAVANTHILADALVVVPQLPHCCSDHQNYASEPPTRRFWRLGKILGISKNFWQSQRTFGGISENRWGISENLWGNLREPFGNLREPFENLREHLGNLKELLGNSGNLAGPAMTPENLQKPFFINGFSQFIVPHDL